MTESGLRTAQASQRRRQNKKKKKSARHFFDALFHKKIETCLTFQMIYRSSCANYIYDKYESNLDALSTTATTSTTGN
jgi:hypothetical protein